MGKDEYLTREMKHDDLTGILTYILAGLTGHTDGHQITSITVQQAGISDYRVVIRATGRNSDGATVRVVGFTNSYSPGNALLLAEDSYARNVIKWKTDRFAESVIEGNASENGRKELVILD